MNNPRSLEITTRIGCQNMCRYCPQLLLIDKYGSASKRFLMSFSTFKTCLDKVPLDTRIDFSGMAEPWLNPDCTKMVLYAHRRGFHNLAVYTSGVGMNLADIEAIRHLPFSTFFIHLADKDYNAKITVDRHYLKIIKALVKAEISHTQYMTMGTLHPQLKSIIKSPLVKVPMVSRAGNLEKNPKINHHGPITCGCAEWLQHNVLLPNGDVLLCCMDYGMQHVLGNLLTDSYESLFSGREFQRIIKLLSMENSQVLCRHCEYGKPVK